MSKFGLYISNKFIESNHVASYVTYECDPKDVTFVCETYDRTCPSMELNLHAYSGIDQFISLAVVPRNGIIGKSFKKRYIKVALIDEDRTVSVDRKSFIDLVKDQRTIRILGSMETFTFGTVFPTITLINNQGDTLIENRSFFYDDCVLSLFEKRNNNDEDIYFDSDRIVKSFFESFDKIEDAKLVEINDVIVKFTDDIICNNKKNDKTCYKCEHSIEFKIGTSTLKYSLRC